MFVLLWLWVTIHRQITFFQALLLKVEVIAGSALASPFHNDKKISTFTVIKIFQLSQFNDEVCWPFKDEKMTKDNSWICVVLQSFWSMSICFKLDFVDENLAEIWWDQYINMLKLHGNEMTKKLDVCGRQAGPQSSCQTHFISPSALHRMVMLDLMMINMWKKKKNKKNKKHPHQHQLKFPSFQVNQISKTKQGLTKGHSNDWTLVR